MKLGNSCSDMFDGQFTGLLDKNGKRVYFGDWLEFDPKEWGGGYRFQVHYDPTGLPHYSDIPKWCHKIPTPQSDADLTRKNG